MKKTNKVLFAFVLFPYLKISFPAPQMFREREREGLLFPCVEKAGLGARDTSKCFADERILKNAETLGAFS